MILLIDNYDSFAYNLARYIRQLGKQVTIVRNDQIQLAEIQELAPAAIVISPGPCTPAVAGVSVRVVKHFVGGIPILGVCLGHQVICEGLGASIVRTQACHGHTSLIHHRGHWLFDGLPSPFEACRYHSLVADAATLPDELEVIATTDSGLVMAVAHRTELLVGVQFHPESILSKYGYRVLSNFLDATASPVPSHRVARLAREIEMQQKFPTQAVTSENSTNP